MAIVSGRRSPGDPTLRDRLYELLEHDHLPYSVGSRFVRLVVAVIVIDVLTMIFASVAEFDARYGTLFTAIEIAAVAAFALEYFARLWTIVGHSIRDLSPAQARLSYVFSSLGVIDLLAFLPSAIALIVGDRITLVLTGMLPFLKLVRYSPALRSLLSAIYAERRALFGCVVILTGVVLLFACLLYAIEHRVQPDKFGNIPQAMWWAIVTLGTVGYGDVVPVTIAGKIITSIAVVLGFAMIALPVAIISSAFAEEVRRRDFVVTWGMLARVPLFSHLGEDWHYGYPSEISGGVFVCVPEQREGTSRRLTFFNSRRDCVPTSISAQRRHSFPYRDRSLCPVLCTHARELGRHCTHFIRWE